MKDTIFDAAKVVVPNGFTLGVVTFTDIENCLKILLLLLTLAYTIWKWVTEIQKKEKK